MTDFDPDNPTTEFDFFLGEEFTMYIEAKTIKVGQVFSFEDKLWKRVVSNPTVVKFEFSPGKEKWIPCIVAGPTGVHISAVHPKEMVGLCENQDLLFDRTRG